MTHIKITWPSSEEVTIENATQSLALEASHKPRRTINGTIVQEIDIPSKYQSTIKGKGRTPNIPTGIPLIVHCQQYIWQSTSGTSLEITRPAVPKSIVALGTDNQPLSIHVDDRAITSTHTLKTVGFKPVLKMQLLRMENSHDSWTEETTWTLFLEEI